MKALIYKSELEYISKCILDFPDIETGGDLFGFWTYSGYPIIQYVIGPGPKTYRTSTFFKQDKEFLIDNGKYLNKKHGLQHLGNWHSHHQLGLPHPSSHDSHTIAKAIKDNCLEQLFLVIGSIDNSKTTINGFQYRSGQETNYISTSWVLLDQESPIRKDILGDYRYDLFYEPLSRKSSIGKLNITSLSSSTTYYEPIVEDSSIWFSLKEGKEFIKNTHSDFIKAGYKTRMFKNQKDQFTFDLDVVNIKFPDNFPKACPVYSLTTLSEKEMDRIENIINNNKKILWTELDK